MAFLYVRDLTDIGADEVGAANIGVEENIQRLNVWIISDDEVTNMLEKIIKPEDLEYTFAIIVPNLE